MGSRERSPPPSPPECCGNGCYPCVLDIYKKRLEEGEINENYGDLRSDLLSDIYFKPFTLIEKSQLTCDVFKFRFKAEDNVSEEIKGYLPYNIGQHLFLKCPSEIGEQSQFQENESIVVDLQMNQKKTELSEERILEVYKKPVVMRAYTPITIARGEKDCCFDIFVKIYENGIASDYLNKSGVGDKFYWRGPVGSFKYLPNMFNHILMVCMGTGLAPMIPVIETILDNEFDESFIKLMYGVKSIDQVILRERLINMSHYWNFSMVYYLSEILDNNISIRFGENVRSGRINQSSLNEYLVNKEREKILVLVCGSDSFCSDVKGYVYELGVNITTNVCIF